LCPTEIQRGKQATQQDEETRQRLSPVVNENGAGSGSMMSQRYKNEARTNTGQAVTKRCEPRLNASCLDTN